MVKRNINRSTYRHETDKAVYLVTLERLKNTAAGCPRYNASIIILEVKGEEVRNKDFYYTANYTFSGHYGNDLYEVAFICERYEQDTENK